MPTEDVIKQQAKRFAEDPQALMRSTLVIRVNKHAFQAACTPVTMPNGTTQPGTLYVYSISIPIDGPDAQAPVMMHFSHCWQKKPTMEEVFEELLTRLHLGGVHVEDMRTEAEVRGDLAEIEADERLHYPPAAVQINAPLALVQMALKERRRALKWVLEEPCTGGCELCNRQKDKPKRCPSGCFYKE